MRLTPLGVDRRRHLARLTRLALLGTAIATLAAPASARVTQVVIKTVESPAFGGKTFGEVGAYERVSGQIVGEVDPKDRRNAVIVDIDLAPKSPNGTVMVKSLPAGGGRPQPVSITT